MFPRKPADLFRDEHGMTSAAMAVSMLLSMALVFTSAQAYKVISAASEIQEVADACVLAAEGEVAEFMVCVKVCDATLLTMTLFSITSYGLGVVAACVPPLAKVSADLVEVGEKARKAREEFAKSASNGLNRLQSLLPFLASASALSVAESNGRGAMPASYTSCAILLPQQGADIAIGKDEALAEVGSDVEEEIDDLKEEAKRAEEAIRKAQKAKEDAYRHDCGNSPGYCQYERAGRFSWMPDSDNPYFSNLDAWSFSVALERAKAYYAWREGQEQEPSGSTAEKASYYMRMKFYGYACEKLELEGYVHESATSFDANFPKLYRNVSEFRGTSLYREASFPVTYDEESESLMMHAWSGCPAAGDVELYDTIAAYDCGLYEGCTTCGFSIESLGSVASASTNIANGFEHHYEKIRQASEQYESALSESAPAVEAVKRKAAPLMEKLGNVLGSIGSQRLSANPPGATGAIAIVVNASNPRSDTGFESLFVRGATTLGTRVAVSGASLVEDSSDDARSVIESLLDGFDREGGSALGGAKVALKVWSGLLGAYADGQRTLEGALAGGISQLSLGTLSGLGDWAASALGEVFESAGLHPANTNALKPALLNTGHLVGSDDSAFSVRFRDARARALSVSTSTGGVFSGIGGVASGAVGNAASGGFTIAEIEFPVGGIRIPVQIALPQSASEASRTAIERAASTMDGMLATAFGRKVWQ